MNKKLLLSIIAIIIFYGATAQNVDIPSNIFKNFLVLQSAINTNGDDEIQVSEAAAFTGEIDISTPFILNFGGRVTTITGIEAFTALTSLKCNGDLLTTLDLSANTALTNLELNANDITALDLSTNTALTNLEFANNEISTIDLSANTALTNLEFNNNGISTIDLSANTALENLMCFSNLLTSINLPATTSLEFLNCNRNNLTSLDISANTALVELYCHNNNLTALDVSANTALTLLRCSINPLTSLDVSANTALENLFSAETQLTSLDLSNNTALILLSCDDNQLTSLDLSNSTALVELRCENNQLATLDLSASLVLETLICSNNLLTSINVSNSAALDWLICNDNLLTSIDVSNNLALTRLICPTNQLTSLDVSANANLETLVCNNNLLTSIDASDNAALIFLDSDNNNLTSIDVSNAEALSVLNCSNNQLTSLDLSTNLSLGSLRCSSNELTSLNLKNGNNTNVVNVNFSITNNPNLSCIKVDNPTYSTNNWLNRDPQSFFGTDCILTFVPDDNFEAYLETHNASGTVVTLGNPTSMGNGIANDDYVLTENINTVTFLDVNGTNIIDLTGIEDFIALSTLYCYNNSLINLDVSNNTALTTLYCYSNSLISLDVNNNTVLTTLYCYSNSLTSLDVSNDTNLTTLWCFNNSLTSLVTNTALELLSCSNNDLTVLDLSANTALTVLACGDNQLTSLVTNAALEDLNCNNNNLTALDLSANTALTFLSCSNNQLTSLNVKSGNNISMSFFRSLNNPNLSCIEVDNPIYSTNNWLNIDPQSFFGTDCSMLTFVPDDNFEQELINLGYDAFLDDYVLTENINTVTFLDVNSTNITDLTGIEDFIALTTLYCYSNSLTSLDVSNNTTLTTLWCFNNSLTSLVTNTALELLSSGNNDLTALDLSANTALTVISCEDNQLTSLNVKSGNNTSITFFRATNNPNLLCIEVDNVTFSTANWTNIDPQTSFSETPCNNCIATTIWNGTMWDNGTPDSTTEAIFNGNYTSSDIGLGSIDACEVIINLGFTLTISAGDYLKTEGDITVDGTLLVENEGSLVQVEDVAIVNNNGSITVRKTTPFLDQADFMILGNPMTLETREGVYGNGKRVLNHITGNFVPNGAVSSGTENFVDDNNNNWANHTGLLTQGEGYLVKPQSNAVPTGIFNLDYTLGTLNNGVISYNLLFNTTREDSPNILGNPYASAIDNDIFLTENNLLIDAIYYWQHITPPSNAFPGFNQLNFNLGDISVYNQGSGGVAASNGGGIPSQFMASGQGFGVKALAEGMIIFNNAMRVTGPNTDYRNLENQDRQRIWLDINNETYGLKSNMLIAFTENSTNLFENKYDSKRLDTPISLYSILEDQTELAIQGRSEFNTDQEVQLGFKTYVEEEQTYTISIRQMEGTEIENAEVYIEDRLLHIITNLSEENYTFTSNVVQQNDRFVLLFQEKILDIAENNIESIVVYPVPSTTKITIANPQNLELQTATIYDLFGRVVRVIDVSDVVSEKQIDISNLATANYLLIIEGEKGSITKRIIKE